MMQFEYEITSDDDVAAQYLYLKLCGHKRVRRAIPWIIGGLFLIAVAYNEQSLRLAPVLLAGIGVWFGYAGVASLFLKRHFRRGYSKSGLAGKRYKATVDEMGLEVNGDVCGWRVNWPGIALKGEDDRVFIAYGANTIFIFGKQYLTPEQQLELRKILRLGSR
jgi:hypothetical protein